VLDKYVYVWLLSSMRQSSLTMLPSSPQIHHDTFSQTLATAFPRARPDVRSALYRTAGIMRTGTGRIVIEQGDASRIALVTEGWIGLRRTTIDGRQIMPRVVGPGQLVNVLPLGSRASAAESITLTSAEVAMWPSADIRSLAMTDPGLGLDLVDHLADAVEGLIVGLDGLLHQDAARRVARVLFLYRDLFFCDPPLLSRSHLPAMVGTSREMTRRVLRCLESRGIVTRSGRDGLRLLDPAGLESTGSSPT
jgi:CRP-like cAMP-binding protein